MKKVFVYALVLILAASMLVACGEEPKKKTKKKKDSYEVSDDSDKKKDTSKDEKEEKPVKDIDEDDDKDKEPSKLIDVAEEVKIASFEDLNTSSIDIGVTSETSTAKAIQIAQVESNTDTVCIAIYNPTDNDCKVSILREDQAGYTIYVYAHQTRVFNSNYNKGEFPHHDIASIGKIPDSHRLLDRFTVYFTKGSNAKELVINMEATDKNSKVHGKMTYNLVKDGVVYFPNEKCEIKSEGDIALRFDKPLCKTVSTEIEYDAVCIAFDDLDQAVK